MRTNLVARVVAGSTAMVTALVMTALPALAGDAPDAALGWRSLTREDFRGYKKDAFPAKGWTFENGVLTSAKGGGGGDLVTKDQFADFELELEFRTTPKGNSGIMYRVGETLGAPWMTGPEFQVLDDAGHGMTPGNTHSAGGLYDIAGGPEAKPIKGPGERRRRALAQRHARRLPAHVR
jgi:hypothetical protein